MYELMQSKTKMQRDLVPIAKLNETMADESVFVRGRIHTTRSKGKQCFLVLRQRAYTVQVRPSYREMHKFGQKKMIKRAVDLF